MQWQRVLDLESDVHFAWLAPGHNGRHHLPVRPLVQCDHILGDPVEIQRLALRQRVRPVTDYAGKKIAGAANPDLTHAPFVDLQHNQAPSPCLKRDFHRGSLKTFLVVSLFEGGTGGLDVRLRPAGAEVRVHSRFHLCLGKILGTHDLELADEHPAGLLRSLFQIRGRLHRVCSLLTGNRSRQHHRPANRRRKPATRGFEVSELVLGSHLLELGAPSQRRAASPWRVCDIPVTRFLGCFGFRLSPESAPVFGAFPGFALRCSRPFRGQPFLRIHSQAGAQPGERGFPNPEFPATNDRIIRRPVRQALLRLGQKKPQVPLETCGFLNLLPYGVAGRAISK